MINEKNNLIFGIGASDGNDTLFYLQKGFDVVSVEADRDMYETISRRFTNYITTDTLKILNRAGYFESGKK